jgi:hypothetical protein
MKYSNGHVGLYIKVAHSAEQMCYSYQTMKIRC